MRARRALLLCLTVLFPLTACGPADDTSDGFSEQAPVVDDDADGYASADTGGDDCDDADPDIHPDAGETCDDLDNNCDGKVDEGVATAYFQDVDLDGYGDPSSKVLACSTPSSDYIAIGYDCNDGDPSINPDATESCDGVDNDCDEKIDEGAALTFYLDSDGDGFGDPSTALEACSAPDGYVEPGTDCDDTTAAVSPAATEACNAFDDDCDDQIDEEGDVPFYLDSDSDGYGDASQAVLVCSRPDGYSADDTDCNDEDGTVHPGAPEVRGDQIDQDCDGADLPHIDLDLDGWPDLIMTNYQDPATGHYNVHSTIFWGSSTGPSSSDRFDLPTRGAYATCVADLNQDGFQDVVFANYTEDAGEDGTHETESFVYWGAATGPNAAVRAELPTLGAIDCAIGDANGDGWLDLAFANYRDDDSYFVSTYIYYGSIDGFSPDDRAELFSAGNYAVMFKDVDQDGIEDLIQTNRASEDGQAPQTSYIYWGSSGGLSNTNRTGLETWSSFHSPAVADLNADGFLDVVYSSFADDTTYEVDSLIYWGSAEGFTTPTALPTTGGSDVQVSDLNADGHLDLVFGGHRGADGSYTAEASIYWGSAEGFSTGNRTTLPNYQLWSLAIADLDMDGYPELVFPSYYDGVTVDLDSYVYLGGPEGYSTDRRYTLPTHGPRGVATFDLDVDGYSDVVLGGYTSDSSSLDTEGYVYWGSSSGFDAGDRVALPTQGNIQVKVAGDPR